MITPASAPAQNPLSLRLEPAKVVWENQASPRAEAFDDIYFSSAGAEFETEHVFLVANQLKQRWLALKHSDKSFCIGEIGFGTGLNFAKTLQLWDTLDARPAKLHYLAFEKHPLSIEDMGTAHSNWPHLAPYFEKLLAGYFPHSRICLRITVSECVTLDLHFGDALTRLKSLYMPPETGVNCWFLDGFSPKQNLELWSEPLCYELARLSSHNGTLSTYSSAGWVRANLTGAGFQVTKVDGFAGKRHMLSAAINKPNSDVQPPTGMAAWAIPPSTHKAAKSAVVIGAGLAGASVAFALAQRGLRVNIIDCSPASAYGASGIRQLALRPRLFKTGSAIAEFYLQAYLFAQYHYKQLNNEALPCWYQNGVLQSIKAQNKKNPLSAEQLALNYGCNIVDAVSNEEAIELAGLCVIGDYLYFPNGGWLDHQALCNSYLSNPNITRNFGTQIESVEPHAEGWLCKPHRSLDGYYSDLVVLANGINAVNFPQTSALPLSAVRGQATYIKTNIATAKLNKVVMGERSLFPSFNDQHTVSASYRRNDSLEYSLQDDKDNIAGMGMIFDGELGSDSEVSASKVALRCNAKDFLPVIGAVADTQKTQRAFAALKLSANASIGETDHYHRGLYITAGHGSNGAATCPLAAEYIAGLVCGESSILTQEAMSELSSARFLIRELKSQI